MLFESLLENYTIISLDVSSREGLYRNRLGEKGAQALEGFLRYSATLTFLSLAATSLTAEQLKHVFVGI